MKLLYGLPGRYLDVTHFINEYNCCIPLTDHARVKVFQKDPLPGELKHVQYIDDYDRITNIPHSQYYILRKNEEGKYDSSLPFDESMIQKPEHKLQVLHSKLIMRHGSLNDEFPEQLLAVRFISPSDKVLELGGNIGRNSCVIGKLLDDSSNLVVLETNSKTCAQLMENRMLNNLSFKIENAALSKSRLVQKGWVTKPLDPSNDIPSEHFEVPTITWDNLKRKYMLDFTALVADCEGALYTILQEEPGFFSSFDTIIMENDYWQLSHKELVDSNLRDSGFTRIYVEGGGWGPCKDFFYEVWKKTTL